LYSRKNTNKYEFKIDKSKQDSLYREVTIENTLYLSRATQHGYDKTKPVYEFFLNNLITSFNQQWEVYTANEIYKDTILKNKILDFLKKTDFTIEDIIVEKKKGKINIVEFGQVIFFAQNLQPIAPGIINKPFFKSLLGTYGFQTRLGNPKCLPPQPRRRQLFKIFYHHANSTVLHSTGIFSQNILKLLCKRGFIF